MKTDSYDGDMTAYVVDGEALNELFGDVSVPNGEIEVIGEKGFWGKFTDALSQGVSLNEIIDSIRRHSMEKVIKELSK